MGHKEFLEFTVLIGDIPEDKRQPNYYRLKPDVCTALPVEFILRTILTEHQRCFYPVRFDCPGLGKILLYSRPDFMVSYQISTSEPKIKIKKVTTNEDVIRSVLRQLIHASITHEPHDQETLTQDWSKLPNGYIYDIFSAKFERE